jgi:hypothetical protein
MRRGWAAVLVLAGPAWRQDFCSALREVSGGVSAAQSEVRAQVADALEFNTRLLQAPET